jgi:cis-3-alkyl-4-acyloxetan-2-one decarboxylase
MVTVPDWLRPLYPFTPDSRSTPHGARMSYVDTGEGSEAVLMLHGNPTWSFYYRRLILALQPHHRCVVPDHVGMGLSDKPEDYPYTLAARIDDVEALVLDLGLKRIHLVVHDWGGAIGFGLAARHPERIGRIVILNTAAFPSERLPARIALCRMRGPGTWLVRGLNGFAAPATWMAMHRRALTEVEKRGYLWPYGSWQDRVAIDAFVKDIPMTPEHPAWAPLREAEAVIPQLRERRALICWGGRDFCFNDSFYEQWRQRLPAAEAVHLPDAGHYVLEDAANDVIPRVERFLR